MSLQQSELTSEERSERYGPLQQHRRAVASLNKQIQHRTKQLEEVLHSALTPQHHNHSHCDPQGSHLYKKMYLFKHRAKRQYMQYFYDIYRQHLLSE